MLAEAGDPCAAAALAAARQWLDEATTRIGDNDLRAGFLGVRANAAIAAAVHSVGDGDKTRG